MSYLFGFETGDNIRYTREEVKSLQYEINLKKKITQSYNYLPVARNRKVIASRSSGTMLGRNVVFFFLISASILVTISSKAALSKRKNLLKSSGLSVKNSCIKLT